MKYLSIIFVSVCGIIGGILTGLYSPKNTGDIVAITMLSLFIIAVLED